MPGPAGSALSDNEPNDVTPCSLLYDYRVSRISDNGFQARGVSALDERMVAAVGIDGDRRSDARTEGYWSRIVAICRSQATT